MKILGAGIAVPGGAAHAPAFANDYALKAARLALSKARCLPSELDLIVSLSVSPNRMADAAPIAGPRLAHPVQRDLRASNAAVFDLLDADWTLALDLVQSHCRQLGYRRALVVKAEALADVDGAEAGGYADGAGAIVLSPGRGDRYHASYADLDAPSLATLAGVSARHAHETGVVARFDGGFDSAAGRFRAVPRNADAAVREVVGNVRSKVGAPVSALFRESWLRGWLEDDAGFASALRADAIDMIDGEAGTPPAFQLPAWLATRASGRGGAQVVAALTLDAFKPRIACIAMEV
ncbi:hypothetical protein [Burkholderia thailandensis]|uniref:3-Oxoacyl-[acyl-carrier-(ACP)] synthase III family protein n=1 Tax=Burkholderia thailandensis TaxID=57975 RepID=A0AAW9CLS1_BURTH|nr:hypothetical protein [Burkholderia thailandensis]AHI68390.1 3-Oxoacyl-[acyl-carrier-(ACP)] synthase III family protein [Burkholderia thailandensis H0587]AIP64959.1 hypothetical protein DR62_4390 [Burkholderia thailandensis]AIT23576.1 3-Oxoacyl-[acyl-carrier-(ACP)] synthase III family protein [Burkholderia thailandensis E254]AJY30978.1 3-Oxoacyl-[acyl-carrier-(ACP)] synthase III family protein [Burkholderia thailandensis 34]AOI55407.1 hypothetical protein WI24_27085 [Burkholderia thailandens